MNYIITNTDCFIALSTNAHTDNDIIRLEINILANMNVKSLINRQKMCISRPPTLLFRQGQNLSPSNKTYCFPS